MATREENQLVFDDFIGAISKHNKVIAETIFAAETSLKTATEQLKRAEAALAELNKHIISIAEGNHG